MPFLLGEEPLPPDVTENPTGEAAAAERDEEEEKVEETKDYQVSVVNVVVAHRHLLPASESLFSLPI